MSSTYGRKQKVAATAAFRRWGNLEKVTVQDFQCQVLKSQRCGDTNLTDISIAPSSPANSVSAAFLTAPKLPERLLRQNCATP